MRQFRITIPEYYEKGCPGHKHLSARQGHYIFAETEEDAIEQMKEKFPDVKRFDVQNWED